jgi:hypothetical protein
MTVALPTARGPISELLLRSLVGPVRPLAPVPVPAPADPLADEDLHLSLYLLYELGQRGLTGVDDRWEAEPSVVALRGRLEAHFEAALLAATPLEGVPVPAPDETDVALREVAAADDAPSLSKLLERDGTLEQVLEFVVHRSNYLLKEADPQVVSIARLTGRAKAAMVEILADEYGGGRPERVHATLYADTMDALGLDPAPGAYLDVAPGSTLAAVNLMSFFGAHRRLRGAVAGHLALYEMTSSVPNRRYATALRRLGVTDQRALEYFDEHVEADAVHEAIAGVDLAGGVIRDDPAVAASVLWGARCSAVVDGRQAHDIAAAWAAGRSSLRTPLELAVAA